MRALIVAAVFYLVAMPANAVEPIDPEVKEFFEHDEPIVIVLENRAYENCLANLDPVYRWIESGLKRRGLNPVRERGLWLLKLTFMKDNIDPTDLPPYKCDMIIQVGLYVLGAVFEGKRATDIDDSWVNDEKYLFPIPAYLDHYFFTDPLSGIREEVQNRIKATVDEAVDELAAELLRD